MNQFQVVVEILLREPRGYLSEIIIRKVVSRFDLTGQETPPEGRICHDGYAKLSTSFEKPHLRIFNIQSPRGIFDLKGRDCELVALKRCRDNTRVDFVGTAEGFRADF
jgi:hypothetical protein